MKFKGILSFILLLLGSVFIFSLDVWQGNAARIRRGEFEKEGFFAASNSFSINTQIKVTNLHSGKSVDVTVLKRIGDTQNLFLLLSDMAANALGMGENEVIRVAVQMVSDYGVDVLAESAESVENPDRDVNPSAGAFIPKTDTSGTKTATEAITPTTETTETTPVEATTPAVVETVEVAKSGTTDEAAARNPQKDLYKEPETASVVLGDTKQPATDTTKVAETTETTESTQPAAATEGAVENPDAAAVIIPTTKEEGVDAGLEEPKVRDVAVDAGKEVSLAVTRPAEETASVAALEPVAPGEVHREKPEVTSAETPASSEEGVAVAEAEPEAGLSGAEDSLTRPQTVQSEEKVDAAVVEPAPPAEEKSQPAKTAETTTETAQTTETTKVVTLEPADKNPPDSGPATKTTAITKTVDGYYIQIGAFADKSAAEKLKTKYEGLYPVVVQQITVVDATTKKEKVYYKVMIGPLNKDESGVVLFRFKAMGFRDAFVKLVK